MVASPRQALAEVRQLATRREAPIVLELDLTTDPVEGVPADPFTLALARRRATLREIVDGLHRAASDPRVSVVVAHLAACGMPLARAQEIRDAIEELRAAGRRAIAYADTFGEFGGGTVPYYLACAFDEIWLAPPGDLGLNGVAMETPFLRDALDRLGIMPDVGQRYEYKNAVNTLVERDFTPAHLEAASRIVQSCAEQIVAGVCAGRRMSEEQVRRLIDTAPMSSHSALAAGLVDRLGYRDEAYAYARELARAAAGKAEAETGGAGRGGRLGRLGRIARADGEGEQVEPELMYVTAYRRAAVRRESSPVRRATAFTAHVGASFFLREVRPDQRPDGRPEQDGGAAGAAGRETAAESAAEAAADQEQAGRPGDDVVPPRNDPKKSVLALIHGTGPVVLTAASALPAGGPMMTAEAVAAAFRSAARDPSVAAAVFRVDSPGGSYVASDVIRREVERFRSTGRPVVVSMGSVAASGGYFVSLAADRIMASPGTLTGSIGVFGGKQVIRGLLDKIGIAFGAVAEGENALMTSPRRPFTVSERAKLEEFLDRVYADFVDKVARARGMSHGDVHELARGRVWTGADAFQRGLVDELGGLERAIQAAWEMAGMPADCPPRVRLTPKPSVLDLVRPPHSSEDRAAAARAAGYPRSAGLAGLGGGALLAALGWAAGRLLGPAPWEGGAGGLDFAAGWGALAPLAARAGLPAAGPLLMPPIGQIR